MIWLHGRHAKDVVFEKSLSLKYCEQKTLSVSSKFLYVLRVRKFLNYRKTVLILLQAITMRLLILLLILLSFNFAKADVIQNESEIFRQSKLEKNFYIALGLAGPILQYQGFLLATLGYKFNDVFELTLTSSGGGQRSLPSKGPYTSLKGQVMSLGLTYFPDFKFQNLHTDGFYIRTSIAQQDLECAQGDPSDVASPLNKWNVKSTGIEFELGFQAQQGNLIIDFSPAILFVPTSVQIDGISKSENYIPLRILNFRVGYIF